MSIKKDYDITCPEFLRKSAIVKERRLTGSGFEAGDLLSLT
ncbi:MAG: hypothetical protein AB4062_11010 [Crocosphaera sp.]